MSSSQEVSLPASQIDINDQTSILPRQLLTNEPN